ncbi:MAG: AMP-binding protein [bacterium]|nr:AMP-binding protein [bacterium]
MKIIKITDEPILAWDPYMELLEGEIGEIVVQGPWVTREYFNNEAANSLAKIPDGETFWHRMGDVGYLDEKNRIWFCGRKSHRVTSREGTLFTIPCEAIFNQHPDVRRSALVGIGSPGNQEPVIIIEAENTERIPTHEVRKRLSQALLELGADYPHTKNIRRVLYHPSFPVDIRHNAKIFREKLANWAAEKIREGK